MMSPQKKRAMEALKKELEELKNDPIVTMGVVVKAIKGDVFHWQMTMLGPQDTPYAGGLFYLTADFPDEYPDKGPEVKFVNRMYHLNVSNNGHVCINTLSQWTKGTTMTEVLSLIFALFYKQNPKSAYDTEMANLFVKDKAKFDQNARIYTDKYANIKDDYEDIINKRNTNK